MAKLKFPFSENGQAREVDWKFVEKAAKGLKLILNCLICSCNKQNEQYSEYICLSVHSMVKCKFAQYIISSIFFWHFEMHWKLFPKQQACYMYHFFHFFFVDTAKWVLCNNIEYQHLLNQSVCRKLHLSRFLVISLVIVSFSQMDSGLASLIKQMNMVLLVKRLDRRVSYPLTFGIYSTVMN